MRFCSHDISTRVLFASNLHRDPFFFWSLLFFRRLLFSSLSYLVLLSDPMLAYIPDSFTLDSGASAKHPSVFVSSQVACEGAIDAKGSEWIR